MEPLAALSLASCIAQLLEFASKAISQTTDIMEFGSTSFIDHAKTLTSDLLSINSSLESEIPSTDLAVTKEEQVSTLVPTHTLIVDHFVTLGSTQSLKSM